MVKNGMPRHTFAMMAPVMARRESENQDMFVWMMPSFISRSLTTP